MEYFVSPDGDDHNPGTKEMPYGTIARRRAGRGRRADGVPTGGSVGMPCLTFSTRAQPNSSTGSTSTLAPTPKNPPTDPSWVEADDP